MGSGAFSGAVSCLGGFATSSFTLLSFLADEDDDEEDDEDDEEEEEEDCSWFDIAKQGRCVLFAS